MQARTMTVGKLYNYLTIVDPYIEKRGKQWCHLCRCVCGIEKIIQGGNLISGTTVSCGCFRIANRITHGRATRSCRDYTYSSYHAMLKRCVNKNCPDYMAYGAKGIKVCDRWLKSFENFLEDMGPKPVKGWHIDRIDPYGNYEPGNCQWLSPGDNLKKARRARKVVP